MLESMVDRVGLSLEPASRTMIDALRDQACLQWSKSIGPMARMPEAPDLRIDTFSGDAELAIGAEIGSRIDAVNGHLQMRDIVSPAADAVRDLIGSVDCHMAKMRMSSAITST